MTRYRFFNDALSALAKGDATQDEILGLYSYWTIRDLSPNACKTDAEVEAYWSLLKAAKARHDAGKGATAPQAPQSQAATSRGAWCRHCGGPVSDGSTSCGECTP